ncbi:uncharacterized protein METZ01_LOCUS515671, partial [marine metagenome]
YFSILRPRPSGHLSEAIALFGDLLSRLIQLTRAQVGSWSYQPPVGDDRDPGPSEDTEPAGGDGGSTAQDEKLAGYYANLEIPYGSDLQTVRTAWKRMMKKYHPDLHDEDPGKGQVAAELTRAYQELAKALTQDSERT